MKRRGFIARLAGTVSSSLFWPLFAHAKRRASYAVQSQGELS